MKMKYKNLKSNIKEAFSKQYSNIKTKVKEAIPSKRSVIIHTSVLLPIFYLGAIMISGGDPNPLTMRESYQKHQIKLREERIVEEEHRKALKEKLENLSELKDAVLRKAENLDGQAGLTFIEQAELARKLGYKGMLLEGRINNFGIKVSNNYYGGVYLNINKDKIKVSEESLKNYLENQKP